MRSAHLGLPFRHRDARRPHRTYRAARRQPFGAVFVFRIAEKGDSRQRLSRTPLGEAPSSRNHRRTRHALVSGFPRQGRRNEQTSLRSRRMAAIPGGRDIGSIQPSRKRRILKGTDRNVIRSGKGHRRNHRVRQFFARRRRFGQGGDTSFGIEKTDSLRVSFWW